jgi:hypothetical protein
MGKRAFQDARFFCYDVKARFSKWPALPASKRQDEMGRPSLAATIKALDVFVMIRPRLLGAQSI